MFPMVPLAANQALGIAIMSYDGQLNFGLNADYDALPDLELLARGPARVDRRAGGRGGRRIRTGGARSGPADDAGRRLIRPA